MNSVPPIREEARRVKSLRMTVRITYLLLVLTTPTRESAGDKNLNEETVLTPEGLESRSTNGASRGAVKSPPPGAIRSPLDHKTMDQPAHATHAQVRRARQLIQLWTTRNTTALPGSTDLKALRRRAAERATREYRQWYALLEALRVSRKSDDQENPLKALGQGAAQSAVLLPRAPCARVAWLGRRAGIPLSASQTPATSQGPGQPTTGLARQLGVEAPPQASAPAHAAGTTCARNARALGSIVSNLQAVFGTLADWPRFRARWLDRALAAPLPLPPVSRTPRGDPALELRNLTPGEEMPDPSLAPADAKTPKHLGSDKVPARVKYLGH